MTKLTISFQVSQNNKETILNSPTSVNEREKKGYLSLFNLQDTLKTRNDMLKIAKIYFLLFWMNDRFYSSPLFQVYSLSGVSRFFKIICFFDTTMFLQASYSYEIVLYSQKTRSVENPFIQILHHKIHLTKPATCQLSLHLQPPNVQNPPTHLLGITSTFPALVKAKLAPISL